MKYILNPLRQALLYNVNFKLDLKQKHCYKRLKSLVNF